MHFPSFCVLIYSLAITTGKLGINVTLRHVHCYGAKARMITYSVCLSVTLGIQHAKRMRRIIFSSVACSAVPYFSTLFS
jgi:hypothetical protein